MRPIVIAFSMLLFACPGKTGDDALKKNDAPAPCRSVGQRCEFSPGKYGTCVEKDNCDKDCFVCQSQH